jgi:hypothetical protein
MLFGNISTLSHAELACVKAILAIEVNTDFILRIEESAEVGHP